MHAHLNDSGGFLATFHITPCRTCRPSPGCDRLDYVTQQPCEQIGDHAGYHRLADGTAFAIGYTAADAAEFDQEEPRP